MCRHGAGDLVSLLLAAAIPAGEPKGQTYGGVYQPGPEETGTAEAATYSAPTRE